MRCFLGMPVLGPRLVCSCLRLCASTKCFEPLEIGREVLQQSVGLVGIISTVMHQAFALQCSELQMYKFGNSDSCMHLCNMYQPCMHIFKEHA